MRAVIRATSAVRPPGPRPTPLRGCEPGARPGARRLNRARNVRTGTSVRGRAGHWPYNRLKPGANLELNTSGLDSDRTFRIWVGTALPGMARKARTMKHIVATALGVVALVVGAALLAGKDDIRKFHRMRSM
jgi:hypothetical protein